MRRGIEESGKQAKNEREYWTLTVPRVSSLSGKDADYATSFYCSLFCAPFTNREISVVIKKRT